MDFFGHYFRNRNRLSRPWVISVVLLYALGNIILDVPRIFELIWLRVTGKGRSLLFAFNGNHLINVKTHTSINRSFLDSSNKKSMRIFSVPLSILGFKALYQMLCTKNYNYPYVCHLDINDASSENSEGYL